MLKKKPNKHKKPKKNPKKPTQPKNSQLTFLKWLLNKLTFGSTQSKITDCNNADRTLPLPNARKLLSVVQHSG